MAEKNDFDQLLAAVQWLLRTGEYSDFTIKCKEEIFLVHKAIICPRSPFFEKAFELNTVENTTNVVDLSDASEPAVVKSMVEYFYNLDYSHSPESTARTEENVDGASSSRKNEALRSEPEPEPEPVAQASTGDFDPWGISRSSNKKKKGKKSYMWGDSEIPLEPAKEEAPKSRVTKRTSLLHHVKVFALADKMLVPELKALAARKFRADCQFWWQHDDFVDATYKIHDGDTAQEEDRGLKDIVVETLRQHAKLVIRSDIQDLLLLKPELARDLLMGVGNKRCNDGYASLY